MPDSTTTTTTTPIRVLTERIDLIWRHQVETHEEILRFVGDLCRLIADMDRRISRLEAGPPTRENEKPTGGSSAKNPPPTGHKCP